MLRFAFVLAIVLSSVSVPYLVRAQAADSEAERARLQAQLDQVQKEIVQTQTQLAATQLERTSYERDVSILDHKIKDAQLQIKQRDLAIKALQNSIAQKQKGIGDLDLRVAEDQASLAQILRQIQQADDRSLVELALGGSLIEVFQDMDDFERIQQALNASFDHMSLQRSDLSARKAAQEDQRHETEQLKQIQVLQQKSLKSIQAEKQDLVSESKGKEALYNTMISAKQKSAAEIQAALFRLRDGNKTVSFGDIYAHAKEAGARTGVRPALILGILAEESNLGENVGTGNWKTDMKAPRDTVPFLQITAELGLNPDTQPVSAKPWYGWGGAMGPAQFIPSTWILYKDRIAQASGQNPPNPWDPRTAAFATALLMADNGADAQTPAAERLAALRYLAGWGNASKPEYSFYGDDVMALAAKFQKDIDVVGK